jgi:hypothetical protein
MAGPDRPFDRRDKPVPVQSQHQIGVRIASLPDVTDGEQIKYEFVPVKNSGRLGLKARAIS